MGVFFDVQRFSVYDGPGIRTNVFFKGCPLRCLWCHNPESQAKNAQLMFYAEKCTGCGECAKICSYTRTDSCTACGKCVSVCRNGAREISGYASSPEEIFETVKKDRIYYETSGGGVTLSGGEPLMQADDAFEILSLCKKDGINTAVETCGFVSPGVLEKMLGVTDLFLFDIKGINEELHKKNTGVSNKQILENARRLMELDFNVVFRMPYIPGINSGELPAVREFTKGFALELMGYHTTGTGKYARLGREYALPDVKAPSKDEMHSVAEEYGCLYNE